MKHEKIIQKQISFNEDLYEWLKNRFVENPFEQDINTYSDAVIHCINIVKNKIDKNNKKKILHYEMKLNGATLKYIRKILKSYTQDEISEKINISQSYISKIEKNGFLNSLIDKTDVSSSLENDLKTTLMKLFEIYKIDKDQFIKIQNDSKEQIITLFM